MKKLFISTILTIALLNGVNAQTDNYTWRATGNPIITHKYSADPAPFVKGDTLWLYTGHDHQGNQNNYHMYEWNLYSTTDMVNWTEHPTPLKVSEFKWQNSNSAFAGHVIERNGKWYFYVSTNWCGIGVAVADSPYGPFKDAIGKPLLTNKDCPGTSHSWACIDPFVMIDNDGQAWILWGNRKCFIAKLKENMIEIEGEVKEIPIPGTVFTEAPWVHVHNGKYYLTFAENWPEKIGYAVSESIDGPYEYKGILSETAGNCNTTHPAVVTFLGQDWFFTHNGTLPEGTSYSRSVCVQPLEYTNNGNLAKCDILSNPDFLLTESHDTTTNPESPEEVLDRLIEGNKRYVSETSIHPNNSKKRRVETAPHQAPLVAVVTCSDSRVPAELIFDQGIGDIFTIRSAGNNVNGKMIMGSIEYAVDHLGVKVILVLGHEACGGVTGAITEGAHHHGAIGELLKSIAADIPEYVGKPNKLREATKAHTNAQIKKILMNPLVNEKYSKGEIIIKAAYYDIHTGKVNFI